MFAAHAPITIEPGDKGWDLLLWVSKGFDYSAPFRRIIDELAALYPEGESRIDLPP